MYLVNIWEGWRAAYNIVWTVEVDGVFVLKFKTVREGVHKEIGSFYTKKSCYSTYFGCISEGSKTYDFENKIFKIN